MLSKSLKENLFKIAAAPIAFLGMKIGALIGLISPFTGRRIVARVESLYNFGRSMKESMCSFEDLFSSAGKYSRPDVFYLAQCFQRRSDLRRCIIDETAPA